MDRRTWGVRPETPEGPKGRTDGDPKAFDTHDKYFQVQLQRKKNDCGVPLCHFPSHQTGLSDQDRLGTYMDMVAFIRMFV